MICSNCGKEIPDNHPFCMYCGTPMKKDNAEPAAEAPAEAEAQAETAEPQDYEAQAETAANDAQEAYAEQNEYGAQESFEDQNPYRPQNSYAEQNGYNEQNNFGEQNPYGAPAAEPYPQQEGYAQPQPQYNAQPQTGEKPKKTFKAPMIIFLILMVLFLAGAGVFAYLFFTQKSDLDNVKAENTDLYTQVDKLKSDNKKLEDENSQWDEAYRSVREEASSAKVDLDMVRSDYESLKESYDDLQKDYDSISDELYALYSKNGEEGNYKETIETIRNFYSGNNYSDFHTNKDVVVMRPGDKYQITLRLEHDGGIIYCDWTDGNAVGHEFGSWNVYDIPFTFTARAEGTSLYTFTNSINKESFQVLAIVVDD